MHFPLGNCLQSGDKDGSASIADGRVQITPGRILFGGFKNPDSLTANQELAVTAVSELAAQRQHKIQSEMKYDYNALLQAERDVTVRSQRLAAEKRNSKRNKGGK